MSSASTSARDRSASLSVSMSGLPCSSVTPTTAATRATTRSGLVMSAELDEPGAVGEFAGQRGERAQREARLADAAGASQGHHPYRAHELSQLVELLGAADEAVWLGGQVRGYVRYLDP